MKEKINQFTQQVKLFWINSSKKKKALFFSIVGILIVLIAVITFLTSVNKFVPLYTNLSLQEVGQIKEELDARNIPYELHNGGTTIEVPEEQSEQLLVDLAGKGIPNSGNIDYSFFSENTSWGITDNEFNIMKLDAMQTELANLIKSIEGIEDAKVMITLPQQSVFVSDSVEEASASIVLHTKFGYELKGDQIQSLYHLVSKAVPNLPAENIVIMNQNFEYFDQASSNTVTNEFSGQQEIKREIERDIQKRLQQMLGVMVGMDRVVVSVTSDIDFTNENRTEELIEPVDVDNMEGIPVSIETITETFEGNQAEGGVVGTGEEDIANYPATAAGQDGDYELVKETINYELNRIHRDIAESPYKVRDLGIQVVVDSVRGFEGDEIQLLTQQEQNTVEQGITSILNSIITTTVDKEYGEVNPEEKVSIVFQEFNGMDRINPANGTPMIPVWVYIVGGVLLTIIILLIVLLLKKKREKETEESYEELAATIQNTEVEVPEIGSQPKSESDIQKEQLEKMAKNKPEDFAKLLRSWISDD